MNGFVLFVLFCFILGNPALRDARIALWKLPVLINVCLSKKEKPKNALALHACHYHGFSLCL